MPISPSISSSLTSNNTTYSNNVIIRYFYEGGQLNQGRLCKIELDDNCSSNKEEKITNTIISTNQVMNALINDGVDLDNFYACSYESQESDGGWMPLEGAPRFINPWCTPSSVDVDGSDAGASEESSKEDLYTFTIPPVGDTTSSVSRRIDIKLFRRPKPPSSQHKVKEHSSDALHALSASIPGGKLPLSGGYFGIGVINPKTSENIGTLWRSAYQMDASVLYTIGARYKSSSTDTLSVPARIPLIEVDDWTSFVNSAPKSAVWVVIEMGGTPLQDFEHPRNCIYILGSEDHGVPKSVIRGCREVVSLDAENYGSYNVAVAGSIVMYDRMTKMRKAEE
jgi:tRNA(Leu) C34 or U34 (ribose-2'-O)-methylase TrmL